MKIYNVYRTEKGNLTFKKNNEVVYTIRCSTKLGAEKMLTMLKRAEKRIEEDNV